MKRLSSLDAFRGFDMTFIMGFGMVLIDLAWCCSGLDAETFHATSWIERQLTHVEWEGLRVFDLVFPTFMFIAGISFPFSYARQRERGDSSLQVHLRLVRRFLLLFALGLLYNRLLRMEFPLRFCSVLGKIGFAWMVAALVYVHFRVKARVGICVGMMLAYWLASRFFLAPDAPSGVTDPFSPWGSLAGWIDRTVVPGRLANGPIDGAGPLVSLAASVTVMLGMFAGDWVRREDLSGDRKAVGMVVGAAGLLLAGFAFAQVFPVVKKLWSPSFALLAGGYALAAFAVFYWIMDVRGWRAWAFPLQVIGLNSITVYLFQRLVPVPAIVHALLGEHTTDPKVAYGLMGFISDPALLDLTFWCGYTALSWLLLWFLYRKGVFLRV